MPFSVQDDSIIYLYGPTNEYCLLKDGYLYPLTSLLRGPLALPSAVWSNLRSGDLIRQLRITREQGNHYPATPASATSGVRTNADGQSDNEYTSERTVPLFNLAMGSLHMANLTKIWSNQC